jgi:hypothetical protein
LRLSISGEPGTVNATPALATPLTVTTTFPVAAPVGTVTTIEEASQLMTVADLPLKVTVLLPCNEPKLVPLIVTDAPTAPDVVESLVIVGVGRTVNEAPALGISLTVTTTLPVPVASDGTVATICVLLQLLIDAAVVDPGKVTVLAPGEVPKFVP